MAKSRQYDLAVITGEYEDKKSGEWKSRWLTIGTMWINDDGSPGTILLERAFNPAGCAIDPDYQESGQVYLHAFTPKEKE